MTLTVYHLQVSQSERITWLCEELEIPYKLSIHTRAPLLSPPEIKSMTALGAAPVITDTLPPYSESKPLTLAESAAIVEYIIHKHGDGRLMLPPSHKNYADFLYWWHLSNGNLQPTIGRYLVAAGADEASKARVEERMVKIFKHINERLTENRWLAGDEFTAADIMSVFSFTTMRKFVSFSLAGYDGILSWLQRCADRPAYQRAMQKGDPELDSCLQAESPPIFEAMRMAAEARSKQ